MTAADERHFTHPVFIRQAPRERHNLVCGHSQGQLRARLGQLVGFAAGFFERGEFGRHQSADIIAAVRACTGLPQDGGSDEEERRQHERGRYETHELNLTQETAAHSRRPQTGAQALRALYPTDSADAYERLRADPTALRARLQGAARPIFEDLAAAAGSGYRSGFDGGPCIYGTAHCYVGLTTVFEPLGATALLLKAADTLYSDPEMNVTQPVSWPATRPVDARGPMVSFSSLGHALLDAAVLLIARQAPTDLEGWLGADATALLRKTLADCKARNRLRDYNPLEDPTTSCGFIAAALAGGPTGFESRPPATSRGTMFGLPDLRVVGV